MDQLGGVGSGWSRAVSWRGGVSWLVRRCWVSGSVRWWVRPYCCACSDLSMFTLKVPNNHLVNHVLLRSGEVLKYVLDVYAQNEVFENFYENNIQI